MPKYFYDYDSTDKFDDIEDAVEFVQADDLKPSFYRSQKDDFKNQRVGCSIRPVITKDMSSIRKHPYSTGPLSPRAAYQDSRQSRLFRPDYRLEPSMADGLSPLQYMYRADSRSPEDIFSQGFHPAGANDDLFKHVTGESCFLGGGNSAFVSTSSNLDFPLLMGDSEPGSVFYIYKIRPTNNFYSVYKSFLNYFQKSGNSLFHKASEIYREQNEWAAFAGISKAQIMCATSYISKGKDLPPTVLEILNNKNYQIGNSQANLGPYPICYKPSLA
jgi:Pertussis toxin, subunit 1